MSDEKENSFASGMKAFKDKQYQDAVIYFTRAIEERSDIHKSFNALGVTYTKIGNKAEAELCFTKALVIDPHNPRYEKNLRKVNQKPNHVSVPEKGSRRSESPGHNLKLLLMIGISLIGVAALILFIMISLIPLQSGTGLSGDGSGEAGLDLPFLQSLMAEERIAPTATVTVQNKKIEYSFDQHQDLTLVKRIEAMVILPDGTQAVFPVVTNPQKSLYYGIDDPFFGKEKHVVVTGYYSDETQVTLADSVLPPR